MGSISVVSFSHDLLVKEFGFTAKGGWASKQSVEYTFEYLTQLSATAVLVEDHYVDRHYLDDFAGYYSRSFRTPTAECQRFHFFKKLTADTLSGILDRAYREEKDRRRAQDELQVQYLGFIVKRPLERARIGRTVLLTYPEEGRRRYGAVRSYKVNVGALQLEVEGLAFQEQDGGAAVCASTALWSALQRVARVSGHRSPTPSQITRAAKSPYPTSHGLDLGHMATALSNLGYLADQFVPADNRPLFRAKVATCLDSQLPVVLAITKKTATSSGFSQSGHAVTVTGYSEPKAAAEIPPLSDGEKPIPMRAAAIDVVYVHDDNLGFHAHYEIRDSEDKDEAGNKRLILLRGRNDKPRPAWLKDMPDEWVIEAALVPKPDKLRLSIETLFHDVLSLRVLIEDVLGGLPELSYGARFTSGITYRAATFGMGLEPADQRRFHEDLRLPRHVGVLSIFSKIKLICDVLIDVSEYQRHPLTPSIVGFACPGVPKYSAPALNLNKIASRFGAPIIAAPETRP